MRGSIIVGTRITPDEVGATGTATIGIAGGAYEMVAVGSVGARGIEGNGDATGTAIGGTGITVVPRARNGSVFDAVGARPTIACVPDAVGAREVIGTVAGVPIMVGARDGTG